jgi:formylglycine-generating enzyme required for sulfatase activity
MDHLAPSGGIVMDPKVFAIGARPASLPSVAIRLAEVLSERESRDPRRSDLIASTDLWMVQIPAGTFMMGSPEDQVYRHGRGTQHEVTLSKAFWLGQTPVTQAQWQAVMGTKPSLFVSQSTGDDDGWSRPVECVTWYDAIEFCNWLTAMANRADARLALTPCYRVSAITREWELGQSARIVSAKVEVIKGADGYRLPTEAEWEYACRAGTTTAYSFGDDESMLAKHAWVGENSGECTHPVATRRSNAWGLFDMHGNVNEWCWDWYGEHPRGVVTDPQGPRSGSSRVFRGSSWGGCSQSCRAATRNYDVPGDRDSSTGFRVARTP